MNNNCENYKVVSVKKEVEDTSYFEEMEIDHKHFKSVEVKEVIEDEMKQENIENDLSNIFIKQECNLEIDWDCADDEQHIYNTNVTNWTSINMNSTNLYYKNKLFQCPECSVNAKYEANLNKHISIMHPKYKPLSYRGVQNKNKNMENICSLQTADKKDDLLFQKENLLGNYSEKRFSKKYKFKSYLKERKFIHSCSGCAFKSNYKKDFIFHVYHCHYNNKINNSSSTNEIFVCPFCSRHYQANQKLKSHLVYCCKLYLQCDHCLNYFKGKSYLRQHIFSRHFEGGIFKKIKEDNLHCSNMLKSCPRCGKRYQYSLHLSRHINTCGKKKLFQCSTCIFTTKYEHCLIMHILQHLKKSNLCLDLNYGLY
ncbi:zinc finger protein 14-like isoform X1 [Phymastichus coffea]|uniref:zinc finger protein 14-like isoform X1 n=1 Tax=Phymastichus coffea TaxID=108790 RepID=UPI00273B1B33|nr:zinc finger protein 14-like isoform X1 [Phymastichus coffea]